MGPAIAVTNATNATPIAVTLAANYNLAGGDNPMIRHVQGNLAANGTFRLFTNTGPTTFTLDGVSCLRGLPAPVR